VSDNRAGETDDATAARADATGVAPASFSVVAGDPTPAELAAVTAVVSALLEEIASDHAAAAAPVVSAWRRSQRAIRTPITRGIDSWRGFSG
jgi:hypothetical protein